MKFILTTLSILILINTCFSQKLKRKTETSGNIKEVFYIDKESKMMNGDYFKINIQTKDTLVYGKFDNGMRTGVWTFNHPKNREKQIIYNFSIDSLQFLKKDLFPDSFLVKVDNEFIYTGVERPLIFIGYDGEIEQIIGSQLDIPKSIFLNGLTGSSMIRFLIDERGNLITSNVIQSFNKSVEQQVNAMVNTLNGRFLPAVVNGIFVPSIFYVVINFSSGNIENMKLPKKLPYIIELDISTAIITKTITYKRKVTRMEIRDVPESSIGRYQK